MRLSNRLLLVGVPLLVLASEAKATPETLDVTFSATGFTSEFGQTVPFDPVTGSFSITFDPALSYDNAVSGITLGTLGISLGSALSFTYYGPLSLPPAGYSAGELVVGGLAAGAEDVTAASDDFFLEIVNLTSSPAFSQFEYSQLSVAGDNLFYTTSGDGDQLSVVSGSGTNPVPEPASLALLGGALFVFGMTRGHTRATAR